jgi:Ca-activated chloride channel family protein
MWAIRRKPTNCIKAVVSVQFRSRTWLNTFPGGPSTCSLRPTFSQPGNPNGAAREDDKDLTPPAKTCANILRYCGAYMTRQNGRGSSRPWVLNRSAISPSHYRVSARNCLLYFGTLLSFVFFPLLTETVASAQEGDLDSIHVSPRIQPTTKTDPAAAIVAESLRSRIPVVKSKVDLVLVPVTVTDPMNRLVTGLDKENFQVFEGKEAQEVRNFSAEDAPVSLGVIFDMSGSMSSKVERAREAVIEFFKTANPQDEFFLIAFADKPEEVSDFTQSIDDLQGKLVFTVPKGRTALLDAIYLGVSKMRQAKYPKKALLIISDGGDNHSRYTEGEIKNLVKEADVMIYSIGIYDHYFQTEEERLGPALLSDISDLSGGRSFTIDNPNDLADVATKIGIELRNQYVLGYRPKNPGHDGKWHKIKVKLQPPKGLPPLHVYARTGYYASSQ